MAVEEFLASLGLGGLLGEDVFAAQIGVLALTVIFLLCSLALCILTFRAAAAAGKARRESRDFAVEVRRLTAQVEKSVSRRSEAARRSAEAFPEEAEIEFLTERDAGAAAFSDAGHRDPAADRSLEEANKAATIPSVLLKTKATKARRKIF